MSVYMCKKRVFGNEPTHLVLTGRAKAVYECTDPLTITEFEQEDGTFLYSLCGAFEDEDLTAEQVNDLLEEEVSAERDAEIARLLAIDFTEGCSPAELAKYTMEEAEEDCRTIISERRRHGNYVPVSLTPCSMFDTIRERYAEVAKKAERMKMVKAMEFIARQINDEDVFDRWLMVGVADGDIDYGDLDEFKDYSALEYYTQDSHFADLMQRFLNIISGARESGGLYCDGIVSKIEEI